MKPYILAVAAFSLFCSLAMAQSRPDSAVSKNYFAAQEALAADNLAKARTAFTTLAQESAGDLKAKAQAAAEAKDINNMRKAFKTLSDVVIKMQLPKGYAVAFCPMFEGGSSWAQKGGKISNPYFGKSMPSCGEFKTAGK